MKMNNIRKISLSLALVMIIASLFSISALADNMPYVAWSVSDDLTELKNETIGTEYHLYNTGINVFTEPSNIYVYAGTINEDGSVSYGDSYYGGSSIYQNPDYKDAVWIEGYYVGYYGNNIFVTDKGERELEAFLSGDVGSFWLSQSYYYRTHIDANTVADFDKALHDGVNTKSFDVKDIEPSVKIEVYEIYAMDKSETFTYVYGAIYKLGMGEYWYVNYHELGNQYFDANGDFSYRRGSVTMTKIEDAEAIDSMLGRTLYFYPDYVYENDGSVIEETDDTGLWIVFWIAYILCFVLPPIPMIIVGFILPFFKKLGKPKYWFIFVAFALLWLIAALVLAVLAIVMMFILLI